MFSQNMGYNVFGFGPGNYLQAAGEGFDEYGRQRENGVPKEIAARRAAVNAGISFAGEKLLGYADEWLYKHTPRGKIFGITADANYKDIADDIYYPRTKREASVFDRSFANKTSGLKDGETKRIIIDTADNVYFIEANRYMSGEIVLSISNDENAELLKSFRRSFLNGDFNP